MTTDERFERIERKHEELAELVRTSHVEMEAGFLNVQKLQSKTEETLQKFMSDTSEKIGNLTILVDRLVARDLK